MSFDFARPARGQSAKSPTASANDDTRVSGSKGGFGRNELDDRLPGLESDQQSLVQYEEVWTGDYIFENEWQSFRTKRDRSIELKSIFRECQKGRRKIAVKVVDIFGNDTMTIVEINI